MKLQRFKENPFLKQTEITVKNKKVAVFAGDTDKVLMDTTTGEINHKLTTTIFTQKIVDDSLFIKLFAQNIGLTFNMTSNGIKVLNLLMLVVQYKALNTDRVLIDKYILAEFNQYQKENNNKTISETVLRKGLIELQKASIIAKTERKAEYFINPHFMFNGNRIRFVTEVRRKSSKLKQIEELEEAGQQRMFS